MKQIGFLICFFIIASCVMFCRADDEAAQERAFSSDENELALLETDQKPLSSTGRSFQISNPDISVIGDFLGHASSKEKGFDEEFLLREIELGFSASIDPYARADIFLGIHKEISEDSSLHDPEPEENVEEEQDHYQLHVEEAYFTFLTLPFGLQAKAGKFKVAFGNVNTQHLHNLLWVEYPLLIRNYFGEEGFAGEGLSVSWVPSTPWVHYMELDYEIFNNDHEILFAGHHADGFVHLLHLKNYWDFSESVSLEVGLSGMTAPNDGEGQYRTTLEGMDITLKWRPLQKGLYQSLLWQTEVLLSQKEFEGGREEDSWGAFTAFHFQFARRWSAGARVDSAQFADHSEIREREYSAYVTFTQSEYCFWRAGYTVLTSDREVKDGEHQFFLQLNIGIGPHRAHEY